MLGLGVGVCDAATRQAGGGLAGFLLALDYRGKRFRAGNLYTPHEEQIPGRSYSRNGDGTALGLGGTLYNFLANNLRRTNRGNLIEEVRTNLCTNYNANPNGALLNMSKLGDAAGVLSEVDDSAALAAAGLSGICTSGKVYKIDNTLGTTEAYAVVGGNTAISGTHIMSAYIRGGSGRIAAGASSMGITNFAASEGYVRQVCVVTPTAATALTVRAGAGQVVYFILNQNEAGASVSSVIPTTGAAVSRAADAPAQVLPTPIPNGQNFTIQERVELGSFDGGFQRLFTMTDGTAANFIFVERTSSATIRAIVGVSSASNVIGNSAAKPGARSADIELTRSGNLYTFTVDGIVVGSLSVPSLPTITTLFPGTTSGAGSSLNGYIQFLGYKFL